MIENNRVEYKRELTDCKVQAQFGAEKKERRL